MEHFESSPSAPHANGEGEPIGAPAQRRSGRAVKKPEFFAPNSQGERGSRRGKRKRVEEGDGDDEDPDDDTSDGDSPPSAADESGNESDGVRRRRARKATATKRAPKAAAAKRARTGTGRTSTLPLRTVTTKPASKPRKAGRKARAASAASADSDGIYGDVFSRGLDPQGVASEWVSQYQQDSAGALRALVSFVLRASGCSLEITVHDVEDQDNVTGKVSDLQDEYQAQAVTDYPLISRGKRTPHFRAALEGFFHALMASAHSKSVLFDDPAMCENVQLWITTMSSSSLRPFRHTATFIALTMVSALCEVSAEITGSLATTSRQLEAERKKSRRNKERIGALERRVNEGNGKYEVVESVIRDLFDTVFVHRYRDVDPKIRVECVQALGRWISTLPDLFFDEAYLRYLGWVLSDTYHATRSEVLKQLQILYKKKENVGGLTTFTERFRSRIVEMATRDADTSVRVSAIELADVIRGVGLLEPADIDAIGKLIFDADPRVRRPAVSLFAEAVDELYAAKVEELGGEDALEAILTEDAEDGFESPSLSWLKLKCLVEMFQAYESDGEGDVAPLGQASGGVTDALVGKESESRLALATKACYDSTPELREWETLAGYLLFDHSDSATSSADVGNSNNAQDALRAGCKISEEQEIVLLEVLNASVRLCLAEPEHVPPTRRGRKAKKAAKASSETLEATALQLARLIPRLLNKFGPVPAAASAVLRLQHVLDLEVFQQLRQDSTTYSALLDDIKKQFVSHSNQTVLAEASAALLHALTFEDLHEVTEAKLQQLWEDTIGALDLLVADKEVVGNDLVATARLGEMLDTVRRISSLAGISDCVHHFERAAGQTQTDRASASRDEAPLDVLLRVLDRGLPENEPGGDMGDDDDDREETNQVNQQVVISSMKSLVFYFMWKLRQLQKALSDRRDVREAEVTQLRHRRDAFATKLAAIMRQRTGADTLRQLATGTFLDTYTLFATLRQLAERPSDASEAVVGSIDRVRALVSTVSDEHEKVVLSVYVAAEKTFAKKSGRKIETRDVDEQAEDDDILSDADSMSSSSDDENDDDHEHVREKANLMHEQRLCELTGKIVLAVLAGVLDTRAARRGKSATPSLRQRVIRNRARLGRSFKEVVAYLDEPSRRDGGSKKTGSGKQVAGVGAAAAKAKAARESGNPSKSAERIATDDDDDDDGGTDDDDDENNHLNRRDGATPRNASASASVGIGPDRDMHVIDDEPDNVRRPGRHVAVDGSAGGRGLDTDEEDADEEQSKGGGGGGGGRGGSIGAANPSTHGNVNGAEDSDEDEEAHVDEDVDEDEDVDKEHDEDSDEATSL